MRPGAFSKEAASLTLRKNEEKKNPVGETFDYQFDFFSGHRHAQNALV
jgi:hypothetical protein